METQTISANVTVSSTVRLLVASICSAFSEVTIGTKVTSESAFLTALAGEIVKYEDAKDNAEDKTGGQYTIVMPVEMHGLVSAGVGPRSQTPSHYVLRNHRGAVGPYLRRKYAAKVESLTVIVYTRQAYLSDPDVARDSDEFVKVQKNAPTHIVVAVRAEAGPNIAYSAERLIANLAGGNNEALAWTADEIRAKAVEALEYAQAWSVVAD